MTVSVRSWDQIAAVLRYDDGISTPTFGDLEEAAALLAEVAAALPYCPRCGGTGYLTATQYVRSDNDDPTCLDCDHGKVTVEQLAATYARVWKFADEERHQHGGEYGEGWRACIDHLRQVRP